MAPSPTNPMFIIHLAASGCCQDFAKREASMMTNKSAEG
jgi:hypothetical protein